MSTAPSSAAGIRWDLSDLFSSWNDPALARSLAECKGKAEDFARRYRGKILSPGGPEPQTLLRGIEELEEIWEEVSKVVGYASLLYSGDTLKAEYRDLQQRVEEEATALRNLLLFFELEWLQVEEQTARRLLLDPILSPYHHYLEVARRYVPHTLSEPEEKIINEKENTGRRAFGRLFTELISSLSFPLEREGKTEHLTLSETLSLLHNPDRDLRRQAQETVFNVLSGHELVLTFVYDTLIRDHLIEDRLRSYPGPMAARHLSNEIDPQAVDQMMSVTEANYPTAHAYFRLKARMLGLPRLALYDQYAPVGTQLPDCAFERSREIILAAFGAFSPDFAEIARDFFERRWIDAEIRKGKRGGAFCASPTPKLHPYILCNYTDNLRDVMTVAHELGHGLHGSLSRKQTYLNYDTPLTTAETASVFGEFLVFDHLLGRETDPRVQLALICSKIEDTFATVFRQNVLTRFEQEAFRRRAAGRLTAEALCAAWLEANGKYYGDAVEMTEGYRWGWSYIPHFIHTRFYCYSYVFGELLTLSLYRMYREQGREFVSRYVTLLESGGSDSPEALLRPMGVDLHDPGFWQKGLDELQGLVDRAVALEARLGG